MALHVLKIKRQLAAKWNYFSRFIATLIAKMVFSLRIHVTFLYRLLSLSPLLKERKQSLKKEIGVKNVKKKF